MSKSTFYALFGGLMILVGLAFIAPTLIVIYTFLLHGKVYEIFIVLLCFATLLIGAVALCCGGFVMDEATKPKGTSHD